MTNTLAHSPKKKKDVAHARVLGGVAGHELALGFGQVERRAVALRQRRGEVQEEQQERDRDCGTCTSPTANRPAPG